MKPAIIHHVITGAAICAPQVLWAQDLSLEVEVGGFYDSQLVVDEIDIQQSDGDLGFKLGANVELEAINTDAFELELGYDFGQTIYAEFDQFNLQSHVADVNTSARIGGARFGVRYAFSHYRLDGEPLFDMHSITPSVAGFVADEVYARAYYSYMDKDFSTRDGRDATGNQIGASVFKFFSNSAGFVSVSGRWEGEDATDTQFDYDGFALGADLRLPLAGTRDGPRVQFGVDYRDRNYQAITLLINEVRTEDRIRGKAELTWPLNDTLRLETDYRYTDRNSNLPSADYQEHRVSAGLVFQL